MFKYKKDFVSEKKNANCTFLKKYNSGRSQGAQETLKSSRQMTQFQKFANQNPLYAFLNLDPKGKVSVYDNFQFFKRINPISLAFSQMKIHVDL